MRPSRFPHVYLCAFAHYTGETLAVGSETLTLNRPITADDVSWLNTDLRTRGFRRAAVLSFSLFANPEN